MLKFPSIKITLEYASPTITEEYELAHPEETDVTLELSRSSDWWGVFLNVTQNFVAVRKDRIKLKSWYEDFAQNGYSNTGLTITIEELQGADYDVIYEGFADMKSYSDDGKRLKLNFVQDSKVLQFLDGTLNIDSVSSDHVVNVDNYPATTANVTFANVRTFPINSQSGMTLADEYPLDPSNTIFEYDRTIFRVDESTVSGNRKVDALQRVPSDYVFDDRMVKVPSGVSFSISVLTPTMAINGGDSFADSILVRHNNITLVTIPNTNFQGIQNLNYFSAVELVSATTSNRLINLEMVINGSNTDAKEVKYTDAFESTLPINQGDASWEFILQFFMDSFTVSGVLFSDLVDSVFLLDSDYTDLNAAIANLIICRANGFYGVNVDNTYEASEILKPLVKQFSIGVEYNKGFDRFNIRHITEFFDDDEILYIGDELVSSLEISYNEDMTFSDVDLGVSQYDTDVIYNDSEPIMEMSLNLANSFSDRLDLRNNISVGINEIMEAQIKASFDFNKDNSSNTGLYYISNEPFTTPANSRSNTKIQACFSPHHQLSLWSWRLFPVLNKVSGATVTDISQSSDNAIDSTVTLYQSGDEVGGGGNIPASDQRFLEHEPVISVRKLKIKARLSGSDYKALTDSPKKYISFSYNNENYSGYIDSVSLKLGRGNLAEIELLERYGDI